jgi:hypothetical protein
LSSTHSFAHETKSHKRYSSSIKKKNNKVDLNKSKATMTIDLYPSIIYENDLSPDAAGSSIDDICNEIHAACRGFGTDVSETFDTAVVE